MRLLQDFTPTGDCLPLARSQTAVMSLQSRNPDMKTMRTTMAAFMLPQHSVFHAKSVEGLKAVFTHR